MVRTMHLFLRHLFRTQDPSLHPASMAIILIMSGLADPEPSQSHLSEIQQGMAPAIMPAAVLLPVVLLAPLLAAHNCALPDFRGQAVDGPAMSPEVAGGPEALGTQLTAVRFLVVGHVSPARDVSTAPLGLLDGG
jgi:hypothetical protein